MGRADRNLHDSQWNLTEPLVRHARVCRRWHSPGRYLLAAIAAAALLLAACASDDDDTAMSTPVTSTAVPATSTATAVTTTSNARRATGTTAPPTTAAGFDLDQMLAEFVGDRPGGVAVLTVRDGTMTRATAGVANAAGDPITPTTTFRVGSLSKTFIATMVMQLVDERRVDLDDPLSTYLLATTVGADVTIRALLSHRSGLPNFTEIDAHVEAVIADPARAWTPTDVLGYVAAERAFQPDQRFEYSNTNYLLLGQLIEQLDVTDLNTALRQRITAPLGLERIVFATADNPIPDGLAGGWSADGDLAGEPHATYTAAASGIWAAGSLVSTVDELHTFLAALFAGELVSERSLSEMTTVGPGGNGLGLFATGSRSQPRYGHSGFIGGYSSMMDIDPVAGNAIVIVTNNEQLTAPNLALRILRDW